VTFTTYQSSKLPEYKRETHEIALSLCDCLIDEYLRWQRENNIKAGEGPYPDFDLKCFFQANKSALWDDALDVGTAQVQLNGRYPGAFCGLV
jgi:hypothetical protein